MLVLTLALALLAVLLVLLRERDARQLERLLTATARERKELLDRIQHPERAQVAAVAREPEDAPRDAAELAHIGQMVPDGALIRGDE